MSIIINLQAFIERYNRYIIPAGFVIGFVIDAFTFSNANLSLSILIFGSHITIAGGAIFILHLIEARSFRGRFAERIHTFFSFILYFSFGALGSGFLAFYSLSGSVAASWPFLIILLVLVIANEWLSSYRARLVFQMGIFFIAVFSYSMLVVPVLLSSIGPFIFLLSGSVSLIMFALFFGLLVITGRARTRESKTVIVQSIASIATLIIILYFTNSIPPIPLSLKDIGVYHNVSRVLEGYELTREIYPWYIVLDPRADTVHLTKEESVYVFSSVFAPSGLDTRIVHEWQFFNKKKGQWETRSAIDFFISGGRSEGYRGFSEKAALAEGKWRVNVKTLRGQTIGRTTFIVKQVSVPVPSETHIEP